LYIRDDGVRALDVEVKEKRQGCRVPGMFQARGAGRVKSLRGLLQKLVLDNKNLETKFQWI